MNGDSGNKVDQFNSSVRGGVTILLTLGFIYLAIIKEIDGGVFAQTVGVVIAFWFGSRQSGGTQVTTPPGAQVTTTGPASVTTVQTPGETKP